ncbi:MAG TPA: CinA family nicotinamide mononucleotide deamidase-related protein [Pirellulales bacterium]|nr:CinA family nicotinamide mononucleotide deamidase-related protein [Pirellulales bacterium]
MIAEVISIGDELTSGQRLDTNSQWLSQWLGELGLAVAYHTTVADDLNANVAVFRAAVERADVVVATGGLGPTADDLTREALAALVGRDLVLDNASLEHIRGLFARHHREMPERNRAQAMFPEGSRILFNPNGTAPGVWLEVARDGKPACHVFALPGVPAEMFEMFQQGVTPALAGLIGTPRVIRHRRIKCFGAGESHVEQMLPDLIRRGRDPSVGITVHAATITLRITASGPNAAACQAAMEPTMATIRQCLGSYVFGEEDDELEDAVVGLLADRQQTLATAEIGTGGALAESLSRAGGWNQHFLGGAVIRSQPQLERLLGAGAGLIAAHGAGSREVVEAMATACRADNVADFALAIGPFPPEGTKTPELPFYFALSTADKTIVKASSLIGHESIWVPRAAKATLNLLRLALLGEID